MKIYKFSVIALFALLASTLLAGCTESEETDYRELEYGYVQFKLYKEASYQASQPLSRAIKPELDYLSEAYKVKVTLAYGSTTIAQTLTLSSSDKESAEFGLRSDKLKLLSGEYRVTGYSLYDALDNEIYVQMYAADGDNTFTVVSGGMTIHDLTAKVVGRGKVRFSLVKDMEDFNQTPDITEGEAKVKTRSVEREYTFDEIKYFTVTVKDEVTSVETTFDRLPMTFKIHFDEDDEESDRYGYQTSSSKCDSLLSLPAGRYRIVSYQTYDSNKLALETNVTPKDASFTVEDNKITEVKPRITLYESDGYIQDGYALYRIWKALNGEKWYASGEDDAQGSNWDFNRSPDLWCNQPGVQVHSNGRVARLALNNFGYSGHMPAEIGLLTELVELYLGTHNDNDGNVSLNYDPSLSLDKSLAERSRNRMANHKEYLSLIHPATQFSSPCAMALEMHDIHIPATALYDMGYTEDEIFNKMDGSQRQIRPMDMNHGKLTNGLLSLPKEIGNLKKLEYLFIANSPIEELPAELAELEACTDVEVYNCPNMTKFPMSLAQMPSIISLNISNNSQWGADEIYNGLTALAEGPSGKKIQILYSRQNSLKKLPEKMSEMHAIGLLDLAYNNISELTPLGKEVAPVQLYLNYNNISSVPLTEEGIFCTIEDCETINFANNRITQFPNMFTAKTNYVISSVDFSNNLITDFPTEFKGINVETFSLACNPITKFPKCLADTNSKVSYIILRGCEVNEIPEGSFSGEYSYQMISFDLSYNKLTEMPDDFTAISLPFLYGLDVSYNSFAKFPWEPLNCSSLTVFAIRCQRDENGARCLREWPTGLYNHTGLRAFMIGSNDLRKIDDTISYLIYNLDISDNPNITFDASDICYYWQAGAYSLIYDKTQNIIGCDAMLD